MLNLKGTLPTNVTTETLTKTKERKDVRGAKGWQVNTIADLFKHRRRKTPTGSMPVIDLGDNYAGPIPPAYGQHGEVFVDEIVAVEFLGLPQAALLAFHPRPGYVPLRGVCVRHIDGDMQNCAADNLAWIVDAEYVAAADAKLLRPTNLKPRLRGSGPFPWSASRYDEPRFTGSDSVVGWKPVESKRAAA
ncbi:HNH endonuclease [Mycolicibacterium hippocampi]|uniref:HNH endonuclease n=1 Tax=Mycolicibacterium hippocampi TaxID=659824 RepID=A0A7I9ZQY7_9MYCO|nr:HNH endonuclease [Mycolicibacterium hippocampi]GFH03147.1 hypothetical protein MHIP_36300 [Mycolicibacterium hippocampi]